ncbi:CD209 antigen-like protein C [Paroedura picta]|uniref:CD209 antigen-like protein C n=1 Tax=Paroedura picta TaxID=143630 RepID=UPI004056037D
MPPSQADDDDDDDSHEEPFMESRAFRILAVIVTALLFCGAVVMTVFYCVELVRSINLFHAVDDMRKFLIMSNEAIKTMSDPQILHEARRLAVYLAKGTKQYSEVFSEVRDIEKKKKSGWIAFNGNLYYFSPLMNVYYVAEKECQMNNSKLVYVTSLEEQKFLEQAVAIQRAPHWLGLYRITTGWQWSNGGPLQTSLSYWKDGKPGRERENFVNCAQIVPCGTVTLKCWEDTICEMNRNWICKMKPKAGILP